MLSGGMECGSACHKAKQGAGIQECVSYDRLQQAGHGTDLLFYDNLVCEREKYAGLVYPRIPDRDIWTDAVFLYPAVEVQMR